jgi:hypothetical protein
MNEETKTLPKPTAEVVVEFDKLSQVLNSMDETISSEELGAASDRMNQLKKEYDWFNIEFTDPTTGKKGLKTVDGEVIAPALFDGFAEYHSYAFWPHEPVVAIREGKCGIIKGDGSGQQLCDFKFDSISTILFCSLFIARWDGVKDRFCIIAPNGDIVCPNILTSYGDPVNGIMNICSDDKYGVIDVDSYQCALPEYDDLEMDADADIVFVKDGQRGYVLEETCEFVPVEKYDTDENYIDVPVFHTRY